MPRSRSRSEPGVLAPWSRSRSKKKYQEPEPLKNLPAPQPCLKILYFAGSSNQVPPANLDGDDDIMEINDDIVEMSRQLPPENIMVTSRVNCEGVESFHLEPAVTKLLDPVLLNPNSFENLIKIFREILKRYSDREWIPLVTDGVPHVLGMKVLAESYICLKCSEPVFRDFDKHRKKKASCTYAEKKLEFSKLKLIPGHGHIVMNKRKSVREVTFPLFGSVVAKLLGCNTPKATLWYKNCTNNHQAREHDLIEGSAVVETLLQLYIEDKVKDGLSIQEADLSGFEEWVSAGTPNIRLCYDLWYYFYMGLEAHEIGTRDDHHFLIFLNDFFIYLVFVGRCFSYYELMI